MFFWSFLVKIWCFWLFFMPKKRDVVFKHEHFGNWLPQVGKNLTTLLPGRRGVEKGGLALQVRVLSSLFKQNQFDSILSISFHTLLFADKSAALPAFILTYSQNKITLFE